MSIMISYVLNGQIEMPSLALDELRLELCEIFDISLVVLNLLIILYKDRIEKQQIYFTNFPKKISYIYFNDKRIDSTLSSNSKINAYQS